MIGIWGLSSINIVLFLMACFYSDGGVNTMDYLGTCRLEHIKPKPERDNMKAVKKFRLISTKLMTQRQAWQQCIDRSMTLMTIESLEDERLALQTGYSEGSYWTSGIRFAKEWVWAIKLPSKGYIMMPFNFTNWRQGQPDNGGYGEHCVVMHKANAKISTENDGWYDVPCYTNASVVCEYF